MRKVLVPGLILVSLVLASCGAKKDTKAAQEPVNTVEKVRVAPIAKQVVSRVVEYPVNLVAFEENHLAPASPGRIDRINVEVGSHVIKGQVLVQMDRTQLHQAEVQLKNLEVDFRRFEILNKEGNVAKQQYDQMKTQLEVAKSNVEFLKENTQLRAPFSGVVSGKYYEQGEMYSGSPTASGKAAIVSLVNIAQLKALVAIPESYFPQVKVGLPVQISSDIYQGKVFNGQVYKIYPTLDAATRTFQAEVRIPNSNASLRPGMFARIKVALGNVSTVLVPANAVLKLQGSNERYIFIADNGKAKRIGVTLGQRYDEMVEIMSKDVKEGDPIVVSGQARLLDGAALEIVKN